MNEYQAADIILEYINRPEHHNQMFDADSIRNTLFPDTDPDTIQYVFQFIEHNHRSPPIAFFEAGVYIRRSPATTPFFSGGGFTSLYKETTNKEEQATEKENLELQKLRSENIFLTKQLADYETKKRQLKYSTIANVVLAAIALIELVLLITKK